MYSQHVGAGRTNANDEVLGGLSRFVKDVDIGQAGSFAKQQDVVVVLNGDIGNCRVSDHDRLGRGVEFEWSNLIHGEPKLFCRHWLSQHDEAGDGCEDPTHGNILLKSETLPYAG